MRQARSSKLAVSVKGKTKEGVLDVLTAGKCRGSTLND